MTFRMTPGFLTVSESLGDLKLCNARLYSDARFPWIMLVPRLAGLRELEDLSAADRLTLMDEILAAGNAVRAVGEALGRPVFKLNVGALGNLAPQLHVHVVGRREDDDAWPGPVWGAGSAVAYEPSDLSRAIGAAKASLGL